MREGRILIDATSRLFHDYLDDKDWMIQENANTRKSINGMNNYIREAFTRRYWLNEVYPFEIRGGPIRVGRCISMIWDSSVPIVVDGTCSNC